MATYEVTSHKDASVAHSPQTPDNTQSPHGEIPPVRPGFVQPRRVFQRSFKRWVRRTSSLFRPRLVRDEDSYKSEFCFMELRTKGNSVSRSLVQSDFYSGPRCLRGGAGRAMKSPIMADNVAVWFNCWVYPSRKPVPTFGFFKWSKWEANCSGGHRGSREQTIYSRQ